MSDKNYIISIEGQTVPVPAEVGTLGDDELKRALTPMFPGAANSKIERAEKDGTVTITVVKLAGSKGTGGGRSKRKQEGGLAALLRCKSRRNPAIELYLRLHDRDANELDPEGLISTSEDIQKALETGYRQLEEMVAAHARLAQTAPHEGMDFIPLGF